MKKQLKLKEPIKVRTKKLVNGQLTNLVYYFTINKVITT